MGGFKMAKINRAVILAGGLGTRLHPYTVVFPKPLVPVCELPILEIIIKQLSHYGFTHITIAVNHQAELIRAYFGTGEKWNIKIDYSLEDRPLSTMGPLTLIKDLPENFLVMNGDILTDINFSSFGQEHLNRESVFTIASHKRKEMIDYGVLVTDENSKLVNFKEKPSVDYLVSMGVYMANRKILELIPVNEFYGFDNLVNDLIKSDMAPNVYQYGGEWFDIGRPSDYAISTEKFKSSRKIFLP